MEQTPSNGPSLPARLDERTKAQGRELERMREDYRLLRIEVQSLAAAMEPLIELRARLERAAANTVQLSMGLRITIIGVTGAFVLSGIVGPIVLRIIFK